ncbi:MAG TPA: hypothetical protein VHX37_13450 [Acidobacteriaceae bacterium]|jgi:hypothetical protein|nr:hypothetical protein [Acidobacteriaceae bacterium]
MDDVKIQRRRAPVSKVYVGIVACGQFIPFDTEQQAQEALDQTKKLTLEPNNADHLKSPFFGMDLGRALILRLCSYPLIECPQWVPEHSIEGLVEG